MTRIPLLAAEDAPPPSRAWYAPDGSASALTRSLATAPDLLETLMPFLGQVMAEGAVDLATKELVIVRVSQLNGCLYCLAVHRPLAVEAGIPDAYVDAICDETPLDTLPERDRSIVDWVDAVTLDPRGVSDELVARTLDHVREDQLVELTVLAGAITMLNAYCTAFALPPPLAP